jgi:hypothetical protein
VIRTGAPIAIAFIAATFALGCAKGGTVSPTLPADNGSLSVQQAAFRSNRHVWGLWEINISADHQSAEIVPARMGEMHLNVVRMLEVSPCKNCLTIENIHPAGANELEADLRLQHPYPGLLKYTGFDVRGIFIAQTDFTFPVSDRKIAWGDGVPRMLNPDGYTSLFNPTEYPPTTPAALGYIAGKKATGGDLTATLNPFLAYRRDAERRMFEAGGSETRTVRLHVPAGPIHFGYAIDACWEFVPHEIVDPLVDFPPDANCLEAYKINIDIPAHLSSNLGSQAAVNVEVFDHQGLDTISSVTIEAPDLFTGEIALAYSTQTGDESWLFIGTITNETGGGDGFYPLLAKAVDTESDQNLGEIDAWQVSTVEVSTQFVGDGWARTWGGSYEDSGDKIDVDGSGNVYVTGNFHDTVDFDPDPTAEDLHSSNGDCDVFLSKFDSSGTFVWARTWGGSDEDSSYMVAVDGSGNVYVIGWFQGTVDFNPDPTAEDLHSSNGDYDFFLSKFDPSGTFVWACTWGGSEGGDDSLESGSGVAVDGLGNVYVAGYFVGIVDFDPGPGVDLHSSDFFDIFLSKFDSSGTFMWARTWGGSDPDLGSDVAVDGSGDVYVTGWFWGPTDFDPGTGVDLHSSNGDYDIFLSKFDSSGTFVWSRTWGETYNDKGLGVAVDGSENVYVTGYFIPPSYHDNVFLSKSDSLGTFMWARTWGWGEGYDVAVDGSGNVYVIGMFRGLPADFDPDPIEVDLHSSNGAYDIFLSKFDSSGDYQWARTWGGIDIDYGRGVAVDGSGNVFVTGGFRGTSVDFNPDPIAEDLHSSNGDADAFLVKFKPDGYW